MSEPVKIVDYSISVKFETPADVEQWDKLKEENLNEDYLRDNVVSNLGSLAKIEYLPDLEIPFLEQFANPRKVYSGMWRITRTDRVLGNGNTVTTLVIVPYSGKAASILRTAQMSYWTTHYKLTPEVARALLNFRVPKKHVIMPLIHKVVNDGRYLRAVTKHPDATAEPLDFKNYLNRHGWAYKEMRVDHRLRYSLALACKHLYRSIHFAWTEEGVVTTFKNGETTYEDAAKAQGKQHEKARMPRAETVVDITSTIIKKKETITKTSSFGDALLKAASGRTNQ